MIQLPSKKIMMIILINMGHMILMMSMMRILNLLKRRMRLRLKLIQSTLNKGVVCFTVTILKTLRRLLEIKDCPQEVERNQGKIKMLL